MSAAGTAGHPAWFAAVMGTGGLALTARGQAALWDVPALTVVAVALLLLTTVGGIVLAPRYLRRLGNPRALRAELADPAAGAMLATFPAGVLVLAVGWERIGVALVGEPAGLAVGIALLSVGTVTAVAFGAAWASAMSGADVELGHINGGWLIPPVMTLLVPLGIAPLAVHWPGQAASLLTLGWLFVGMGTVLFLGVLPLLIGRLALRPSPPALQAPSLWIPLAPAGMLGFAAVRLAEAGGVDRASGPTEGGGPAEAVLAGAVIVALGAVGFGLWWAAFAGLVMTRLLRTAQPPGRLPVHPGWWGFVFPVAAMALSLTGLGEATGVGWLRALAVLASLILTAVWVTVAWRTAALWREGRRPARPDGPGSTLAAE